MRRLELDEDEHARLVDALTRQVRATGCAATRELLHTVAAAPRVIAYVVSVDLRQRELPGVDVMDKARALITNAPESRSERAHEKGR